MPDLHDLSPVLLGSVASLLAGAATGLGALPVLLIGTVSARLRTIMLGFGAGVMLSASFFSLIVPGLEAARDAGHGSAGAVATAGVMLGMLALATMNRLTPHEHFLMGREGPPTAAMLRIWLFVFAIALHNLPEGLAVGVGFAGGDVAGGTALAVGIGLQNMPEGLAVAAALLALDYPARTAAAVALATGLLEPVGGLIGALAVNAADWLLPWGLTFAAGAMLYVVLAEIVPDLHAGPDGRAGMAGLSAGLLAMMYLDVALA